MMMPASAPSTPASQEPDGSHSPPGSSYSHESSPRYQTFPHSSWAYQSRVSSIRSPSRETSSRTTVASMPRIVRVSPVTVSTVRSRPSSVSASYVQMVPGIRGKWGLGSVAGSTKSSGAGSSGARANMAKEGSRSVLESGSVTVSRAHAVSVPSARAADRSVRWRVRTARRQVLRLHDDVLMMSPGSLTFRRHATLVAPTCAFDRGARVAASL